MTFTPFSVIPDPTSPTGLAGTFDTMALTLTAKSGVENESGLSFGGQSWVGWNLAKGEVNWTITPVPEPNGLALALAGVFILAAPASYRRLRKAGNALAQKNRFISKPSSWAEEPGATG